MKVPPTQIQSRIYWNIVAGLKGGEWSDAEERNECGYESWVPDVGYESYHDA